MDDRGFSIDTRDSDAAARGDEHPSGLRDAIVAGFHDWDPGKPDSAVLDYIEMEVRAWLSVVSEGEIDAAARAIYESNDMLSIPLGGPAMENTAELSG